MYLSFHSITFIVWSQTGCHNSGCDNHFRKWREEGRVTSFSLQSSFSFISEDNNFPEVLSSLCLEFHSGVLIHLALLQLYLPERNVVEITDPNQHQLISRAAQIAGANSGYLLANKRRNGCWLGTGITSIDLISEEDQDKSEKGREFVLLTVFYLLPLSSHHLYWFSTLFLLGCFFGGGAVRARQVGHRPRWGGLSYFLSPHNFLK